MTITTSPVALLDTSAFIHLLGSDKPLHRKIIGHLTQDGLMPCIDAVVLSEYLAGLADTVDVKGLIERFTKQFGTYSFDARTAEVSAAIFRILKKSGQIPSAGSERQITKVDIMIIASAMVNSVKELLFEDRHYLHYEQFLPTTICGYAKPKFVRASLLPDVITQSELPL